MVAIRSGGSVHAAGKINRDVGVGMGVVRAVWGSGCIAPGSLGSLDALLCLRSQARANCTARGGRPCF